MNIQELSDGCYRSAGRPLFRDHALNTATIAGHPHSELARANPSVAAIDDPSEHRPIAPALVVLAQQAKPPGGVNDLELDEKGDARD
jgi:hypothetical protein